VSDLPETFWRGLEEFNQREFYACHDTLEALWMDALHPLRLFYQGILQLAVAYYHLGNGNWKGGVILLSTGIQRLEYFAPEYLGIDVELLLDQSSVCLETLQELGSEQIQAFDLQSIPQIQYEKESPSPNS
jgi:uncharacterized protein